jgi:hypothetical protein
MPQSLLERIELQSLERSRPKSGDDLIAFALRNGQHATTALRDLDLRINELRSKSAQPGKESHNASS